MITSSRRQRAPSAAPAEPEPLNPFRVARADTGESFWMIESRSQPGRFYRLTVEGDTVWCPCPQSQYRGACAHTTALHTLLQAQSASSHSVAPSNPPQQSLPSSEARHPAPHAAEETHWREEALRRERALLWTNDQPFSLWKS